MIELNTAQQGLAGKTFRTSVDTLSVLRSAFDHYDARRILDIGCGDGTLAHALHECGYSLAGIDPAAAAIDRARERLLAAEFRCALAEALPADLGQFDAAYFVNSLHHVRSDQMQAALLNAISVVGTNGIVLVIEPLAQGSFFRAMRPVEDETRIRAQATQAIEGLISAERLVLHDLRRWNRENLFTGLDDFIAYLARVLPERAEVARRNEAALVRAWRDNIRSIDGMAALIQPMICWTLSAPQEPRR
ncbi:class I SAM-dependent methyltransferase [uncultured Paracoccus sp.]|uniref:class I SAM-dependent methyltransferase n=1 Tax=uncultured Paracoccus sp. TaxID=189685 RepID=UPI0026174A29|nr:class I SAM-dependent methyltransferase [uncultured Paracoccus sp.]